ncbi:hypothetical protein TruAng_002779 [Truncatella angustata]|nr:hypothetical protein TruAng_002779 [Truncatella angustata]
MMFRCATAAPYLMDELLAFSALHLSVLTPATHEVARYRHYAMQLQTRAVVKFHAADPQWLGHNSLALFLFSSLLGMHLLFTATMDGNRHAKLLNQIAQSIHILHGVGTVTKSNWGAIRETEIKSIINQIELAEPTGLHINPYKEQCEKLFEQLNACKEKFVPESFNACSAAIHALLWVFGRHGELPKPISTHIPLAWPVLISTEFVALLQQREPVALVILAHWAVLLHYNRDFWVFGNCGQGIIEAIGDHLGPLWGPQLAWARNILKSL